MEIELKVSTFAEIVDAHQAMPTSANIIILDGGAGRHMFANRQVFSNYVSRSDIVVKVASGHQLEVLGVGDVGPLSGVLHVPGIMKDLISESQLELNDGCYIDSYNGVRHVWTKRHGGTVVITGRAQKPLKLFIVDPRQLNIHHKLAVEHSAFECTEVYGVYTVKQQAIMTLHKSIPISARRLQDTVAKGYLPWTHKFKASNFEKHVPNPCAHCLPGKAQPTRFSKEWIKPQQVGVYYQADTFGPIETPSLRGNTYVHGFIEVTTGMIWVFPSPTKSAVESTRDWLAKIDFYLPKHNITSFKLQSDNGEFQSKNVRALLEDKTRRRPGMLLAGSAYTPQHQGFIERTWRTVGEIARVMLETYRVPEIHWDYAVQYARNLVIRVPPSKRIQGELQDAPFHQFTQEVPSLAHFKPFGCRAWMVIPKEKRRKNWRSRVIQGIYMGISEDTIQSQIIFEPVRNEYITTTHVHFEPDSAYDYRLAETEVDLEDAGSGTISDYEWLVGTRHIDPDDYQLYEVSRVGTVRFRQNEYIVGYRTLLYPNGLVFSKVEPEAIHIEDLVRITNRDEGFQAPSNQRGKRSRPDQADPHLLDDLDGGSSRGLGPSTAARCGLGSQPLNASSWELSNRMREGQRGRDTPHPPVHGSGPVPPRVHGPIQAPGGAGYSGPSVWTSAPRVWTAEPTLGVGATSRDERLRERNARKAPNGLVHGATAVAGMFCTTVKPVLSRATAAPKAFPCILVFAAMAVMSHMPSKEYFILQGGQRWSEFADASGMYAISTKKVDNLVREAALGDPVASFVAESGPIEPLENDPLSHAEAMRRPQLERHEWMKAELAELESLIRLNVLKESDLPNGKRVIRTKWVYKKKRDKHGKVERYRARLVAKGFSQLFGIDYFDTYAPVARLTTLRIVYALTVMLGLRLDGSDVDAAFMNADLKEEIYVGSPVGLPPLPAGRVYKLEKALYGLKQSPKEWNELLDSFLISKTGGMLTKLKSEGCLYCRQSKSGYLIVAIYVDDIVIAGSSDKIVNSFKTRLFKEFKCKDLGSVDKVLNMEISRTRCGGLFLSQECYVKEILKRFNIDPAHEHIPETPMEHRIKLTKYGAECAVKLSKGEFDPDTAGERLTPGHKYREMVGALLWLSMGTRPDIAYAVSQVAKCNNDPRNAHLWAVKRILRYLAGTKDYGIYYYVSAPHQDVKDLNLPTGYFYKFHPSELEWLMGMVDADFANDLNNRRSVTGYVFFLANGPTS